MSVTPESTSRGRHATGPNTTPAQQEPGRSQGFYGPGPQQYAPQYQQPQYQQPQYQQPQYQQPQYQQPQYQQPQYQQPHPGPELVQPDQSALAQQRPTGLAMKQRNPLGVWLGLPLITLGIYSFVWYYKIHREMAEFDRRRAVPVAGPMLVLLFLSWTLIAPLVSFFNTGNRIANAQRAAGLRPTCNAWVGLLLCFVFGLQVLYYQVELNKVVGAYGVPEGTEIALRG